MSESHPTIKEELERKVIEEIERLNLARERGKISEAQMKSSLDSIYNCISGLVDWDIANAIAKSIEVEIDDYASSFFDRRIFAKDDKCIVVARRLGRGSVEVIPIGENVETRFYNFDAETFPALNALNKQRQVGKLLDDNGWNQIGGLDE